MNNRWMYGGRPVIVPPTADIPNEYRYEVGYGAMVQRILNDVEPWKFGQSPIETEADLPFRLKAITVPNEAHTPFWAFHAGHKAAILGLTPFLRVHKVVLTRSLTIELDGSPDFPMLTRVYPGEYMPPLPWQTSARKADGGMQACLEFWRHNSYIYRDTLIMGRPTYEPPEWFL